MKKTADTERLTLRQLTPEEWTLIVNSIIDNGEVLWQFGCEDGDAFREAASEMNSGEVIYRAIVLKSSCEIIGYAGVTPVSGNIEFYVLNAFRRQGYAYEGIRAFIEMCGLDRITAETMCDNEPSIRLLEKLGFRSNGFGFNFSTNQSLRMFEWQGS